MTTLDGIFFKVLTSGNPAVDVLRAHEEPVTGGRLLTSLELKHQSVRDVGVELQMRTVLNQPSLRETEPDLAAMPLPSGTDPSVPEPDPAPNPAMDFLAYYRAPQAVTGPVYAMEPTRTGIFLTTGGIELLARHLKQEGHSLDVALGGAAHALYLHEMFHHIVASASAILEAEKLGQPYATYRHQVDAAMGYNPLEEQLGNAFMLQRVDAALRPALERFVQGQPAGYRDGVHLDSRAGMNDACERLASQLVNQTLPDELAAVRALALDLSQRLVTPDTVRVHVVESPNSAHEFGDWRLW